MICVSPYPIRIKYTSFLAPADQKDQAFSPWRSSEPGPSKSFHLTASASVGGASATRPLTRTSSRPRFGRYSETDTRSPLQAPDLNIFNTSDSSQFLDLVKTVAERVDESAGVKETRSEDLTGMKRKIRTSRSISAMDVNPRVLKGRLPTVAKNAAAISRPKGIHKEDSNTEPEHEGDISGSFIPELRRLPSLHSIDASMQLDVEVMDTPKTLSMNRMDMNAPDSSASTHARIAPLPKRRALSRKNSSSSSSGTDLIPQDTQSTTSNPVMSTPRLHPLLTQQHSRKQQPPPRTPQPAQPPRRVYPPPQRTHLLAASQTLATARPPVLGMRRAPSMITTSHTTHTTLPTRQKAFKPPLQSQTRSTRVQSRPPQSQPSQSSQSNIRNLEKDKVQPVKIESGTSYWGDTSNKKEVPNHHPVTVSEDNPSDAQENSKPDADSSFGDMSFDIDELEETMRMYD